MTEPLTTWEDALIALGKTVKPGPSYRCPTCDEPAHAFAIVEDDDGQWRCTSCHRERRAEEPAVVELTWNDIRGARRVFMEASDWTQLPDVPGATREAWVGLRQQARDVTDLPTPDEAMAALVALREQAAEI